MLKFQDFEQAILPLKQELTTENPGLAILININYFALRPLLEQCFEALPEQSICQPSQIHDLCRDIDQILHSGQVDIAPQLSKNLASVRLRVRQDLLTMFFIKQRQQVHTGDWREEMLINNREKLAHLAVKLVDAIQEFDNGEIEFNRDFIRTTLGSQSYAQLLALITRKDSKRTYDWNVFRELLPRHIKHRFDLPETGDAQDLLTEKEKQELEQLAQLLGPDLAAEVAVVGGKLGKKNFSQVYDIIAQYLGNYDKRSSSLEFNDLYYFPDEALTMPGIREVIFIHLRNKVYRDLIDICGEASSVDDYLRALDDICILDIGNDKSQQAQLLVQIKEYWCDVLAITSPARMKVQLNEDEYFPSLRQRVAMHELKLGKRLLIPFGMGKGKTATAFLCKEYVGAKKMLFICPPNDHLIEDFKSRLESKYYKEGQEPSLGFISSDRVKSLDDLRRELNNEVVFIPYSMLNAEREGQSVRDLIKEAGFDMLVADEAHWIKNSSAGRSVQVLDIIENLDLHKNGHILSLTGTPAPNNIHDLLIQLKIYNPDEFGDISSVKEFLKQEHPIALRLAILKYMLILDELQEWEKYVKIDDTAISPNHRRIYDLILEDSSLTALQKIDWLALSLKNPNMISEHYEGGNDLLNSCVTKIEEAFSSGETCVLVTEHYEHKLGITRDTTEPDTPCFVSRLKEKLGPDVQIKIIDGDTPKSSRTKIIEDSKLLKLGQKQVIVALAGIIQEGINLSHIHRAVCLGPPWNIPDLSQLIRRMIREGNEDLVMCILIPNDTVAAGIWQNAQYKLEWINLILYGGSSEDWKNILFKSSPLGSAILSAVLNSREKLNRIFAYLHNRSSKFFEECLSDHGYAEIMARCQVDRREISSRGEHDRLMGALLQNIEKEGLVAGSHYADIGCGPLALLNAVGPSDREIISVDLNPEVLKEGLDSYQQNYLSVNLPKTICSSMTNLKGHFADGCLDLVSLSRVIDFTSLRNGQSERWNTLSEANRILKMNGILILSLSTDRCTETEFKTFSRSLAKVGFQIQDKFTGMMTSDLSGYKSYVLVAKKIKAPNKNIPRDIMSDLKLSLVQEYEEGQEGTNGRQLALNSDIIYNSSTFILKNNIGGTVSMDLNQ